MTPENGERLQRDAAHVTATPLSHMTVPLNMVAVTFSTLK